MRETDFVKCRSRNGLPGKDRRLLVKESTHLNFLHHVWNGDTGSDGRYGGTKRNIVNSGRFEENRRSNKDRGVKDVLTFEVLSFVEEGKQLVT